jgi:LmbE family N-acetylglucosaminyl deacetylase
MKRFWIACLLIADILAAAWAQPQQVRPASVLLNDIKKLNVLGSVLYIAAHPDDENTRLLAYLANGRLFRTAYLSLTRGDGGQNLIGDEQGIELGLIRTHELMAARRIDGAEQFFTRAYDFGFSKSPAETFNKWDHEKVLSDVVWVVRTFQPDIIVARFPEDSRAGHGHHSASGILAREAFEAAADPTRFAEQLNFGVKPWQAKRMLWNTFNFGSNNTIDSTQFSLDAGGYNPLTGLSYGELAGESRSQHKSQGFGVPRSRGLQREFFTTIKGDKPTTDLMDGVDISWNRMPLRFANGAEKQRWVTSVTQMVATMVKSFDAEKPYLMVPSLTALHRLIKADALESVWKTKKLAEIEQLMVDCMGLYAEATLPMQFIPENEVVRLSVSIINRSPVKAKVAGLQFQRKYVDWQTDLPDNFNRVHNDSVTVTASFADSQPYWLRNGIDKEMFNTTDQKLIGKPVNDPLDVAIMLEVEGYALQIRRPVQYKFTDPVKGELYQPVFVTPRHLVYSDNDIIIFKKGHDKDSAKVRLMVSSWEQVSRKEAVISLESQAFIQTKSDKNFTATVNGLNSYEFVVTNYLDKKGLENDLLNMYFRMDGKTFSNAQRTLQYDHIPTLRHYYQDGIKVLNIDLKLAGKKVGYIEGAGDRVAVALEAMGYSVEVLREEDLTETNLKRFDAIVTGVRAYNVHEYLTQRYDALMHYVHNGGNLIVQYNTNSNIGPVRSKMSPFQLSIGRTRITDEASPVRFLLPDHPVLNVPNKITEHDFAGWIQERSIYHGNQYDKVFEAPIALKDPNEGEESGSLLIAPYGKGNFVYTGLVFFRQLPAGVPGAYRLMANLIGLPKRQ